MFMCNNSIVIVLHLCSAKFTIPTSVLTVLNVREVCTTLQNRVNTIFNHNKVELARDCISKYIYACVYMYIRIQTNISCHVGLGMRPYCSGRRYSSLTHFTA